MLNFLQNIDHLVEAPNGIEKLRQTVLQLAVQGKLVEQNPNDEPASELLKKIKLTKEKLIKEGKLKNHNELVLIESKDKAFELPISWVWARLGEITNVKSSKRIYESEYCDSGIPFYRSKEIGELSKFGFCEDRLFISNDRYKEIENEYGVPKNGDVLLTSVGSIGGCWIVDDRKFYYKDGNVTQLENFGLSNSSFIKIFIKSNLFISQVNKSISGTAYNALTIVKLNMLCIPVPPFNEQKRIVEKVNELMKLIDELQKKKEERDKKKISLNNSSINKLLYSKTEEEQKQNWKTINTNFNTLYSTKENVEKLKQAILQLAVQGKLVEQDPKDEPASELLKKIKAEKEKLVAEGKIKKQQELPIIKNEEVPFSLPKSWEWVRMQQVFDVRDGTHDTPKYVEIGIPLVTSRCFSNGEIDFSLAQKISRVDHNEIQKRSKVDIHDILFSMIGGNLGNMVMVNTLKEFSIKNVALFKYYNRDLTLPYYLKLFLEHLAYGIQSKAGGGAQPFVSLNFLRSHLFPLPTINEQYRIVEKVNELMSLCNKLEQNLTLQTQEQERLVNSLVSKIN